MIAVTGATGQLGSQIIDHLLRRGVPAAQIVAVDLETSKTAALSDLGVEVRFADYNQPESLVRAFDAVDKVLFVSAPTGPDETRVVQHQAGIDAAVAAGVELFAYTSVTRAPTNTMGLAPVHRATEEAIAASGLPAVILRNGWYAENHTATLGQALTYGSMMGSAGEGRMAAATRAELAEAAAIVLTSDQQQGKVYDLTGDVAWTLAELAAEAAKQTGEALVYTDLPAEEYRRALEGMHLPEPVVELIVDADVAIAGGVLDHMTSDLSTLLARPTASLADIVAAALPAQ